MNDQRAQRRLAAILAADVVGYSRLVGVDEEGTLARPRVLRRHRLPRGRRNGFAVPVSLVRFCDGSHVDDGHGQPRRCLVRERPGSLRVARVSYEGRRDIDRMHLRSEPRKLARVRPLAAADIEPGETRQKAAEARQAKAASRAAELLPVIDAIRAEGVTTARRG
jgi:hypothetical protein